MKQTNKSNKKAPVATISLLPEGYGKKNNAKGGRKASRKRKGHYVWVTIRHRTYWRTGSGTKVTAERFETYRKWVSDSQKKGGL